jgi:transposase
VVTVKWTHPEQTPAFFALCERLVEGGRRVQAAMEPSGTYGDSIRAGLWKREVEVFRVSGKRVHDAQEVFDGVPSLHDAKSAALVARLHLDGASERWPLRTDVERTLEALRHAFAGYEEQFARLCNQLEALMARHWPEATRQLSLGSVALLRLLATYGGPKGVAEDVEGARALLRRVGRSFLAAEKVAALVRSAGRTLGVPMLLAERDLLRGLAEEALRAREKSGEAQAALEACSKVELAPEFRALVGNATAGKLVACGVDPAKYASAKALEKALGLNLREHSSGRKKGGLHITRRGDGLARQLLYLAALRLLQADPVVGAWYRKKVERDGNRAKTKAVVAVMRKLARALWHVARGEAFDATKLFDVTRLGRWLEPEAREVTG